MTMTTHNAPTEMLADYASGAVSPGLSLLLASHLTYSPESRAEVALYEGVGGALLADEAPAAMAATALSDALAAIDALGRETEMLSNGEEPASSRDIATLPQPVRDLLDEEGVALNWQFRLPGVSEMVLPGFAGERVSLLRARPGSGIPQHTHEGVELTLVLSGALEDDGEVYRRGDLAVNTEDHDHRPRILDGETCICLVVMTGQMRFTGRFSRALNYLAE
ncbi:MAG: ChrR family anti-sigma-E factor [Pseudomonadota bacterium]